MNWSLVTVPIKELKENPKNPRTLSKDQAKQLQKSLDKFGLIDKPIINTDYQIIAGHQRVKLLKKAKIKEVVCQIPDRLLTDDEVDELCLLHNKATGSWDYDIMADMWEIDVLVDSGFKPEELFSDPEPKAPPKEKKSKSCPHCGETL